MNPIRALIRDHRNLAMMLVVIALCIKALVPSGYMLNNMSKVLTVQLCADGSGAMVTRQIVVQMDGNPQGDTSSHGKSDTPCAYSALSMASLSGADAPLLALALLFIIAIGLASVQIAPFYRASYLRPPLRGPPAAI
ncbi:MAG: DUF2946 family protein [Sphingorhabdus sp.]